MLHLSCTKGDMQYFQRGRAICRPHKRLPHTAGVVSGTSICSTFNTGDIPHVSSASAGACRVRWPGIHTYRPSSSQEDMWSRNKAIPVASYFGTVFIVCKAHTQSLPASTAMHLVSVAAAEAKAFVDSPTTAADISRSVLKATLPLAFRSL
jgi:hypothetical protein